MVQTIQAKNITLHELRTQFNLQLIEDPQFFPEWQTAPSELTDEEQRRLDRIKASFINLLEYPPLIENTVKMVVLSPLLDLAGFYLPPFHIRSEPSIEILTEDEGMLIKGNLDVLVLFEQLWIMAIETKKADLSIDIGRAQLLAYLLASPDRSSPVFGMLTNGSSFRFLKLLKYPTPKYALSQIFDLLNPGNELCKVLSILKQIAQLAQP